MVVCNTQIKERAGVTFDVYTALVQFFGAVHVALLEFLGTLFETKESFFFGRIRRYRMRSRRACKAYMK
jgi:hypothetical protein